MKNIFVLLLTFIQFTTFAQTDIGVKLLLRDGNSISGNTKLNNISLTTDYGKLDIPIANISSIEFGILPDNSKKEKIKSLVTLLSNTSEEMRKNAFNELVALDINCIPVLQDYIYSDKYEAGTFSDYTADNALNDLKNKNNVSDNYSSKDVISIDNIYTIGGAFDLKTIDLKTEFGNLNIPKTKIEKIEILSLPGNSSNAETTFKLMANKHISGNTNGGWLKTNIYLKAGQKFTVTANGEVTLASLSNQKYKPNGTVSTGTNSDYDSSYDDLISGNNSYPTYGNVVYKIGESGAAMKAGAKFSGSAGTGGPLYISIYETVYNAANSGSYTVKISTK